MRKHKIPCKRGFSLFLALTMCVGLLQLPVSAAESYTGGPCEHHTEHTDDCGYVEAVEGVACTHVHDTACGYAAAEDEVPCDKACTDTDGDGVIDHAGDCVYQAAEEGSPCAHAHDAECGYVKAVAGHDCGFVCEICSRNSTSDPETCTCRTQCTADQVNADCPVCGAEGADLGQCTGTPRCQKHTWGEWYTTKEPTCSEFGSQERVCSVCGEKGSGSMMKLPHNWGEWTVTQEATAEELGEKVRTCQDCGEKDTVKFALGSDEEGVFVAEKEATYTYKIYGKGEFTGSFLLNGEEASFETLGYGAVRKVIFAEGVTGIGKQAFSHRNCMSILEEVELPSTLTRIEEEAFYSCSNLRSINLEHVTSVGKSAFSGANKLEEITISPAMTEIGEYAFEGMRGLKKVVLPEGVRSIGANAFLMCAALESVVLPESLETIGEDAFSNCTQLKTIGQEEGKAHIDGVNRIGSYAFEGCFALKDLRITDVETIEPSAFFSISVEKIAVDGVGSIGDFAFQGSDSLKEITLENVDQIGMCIISGIWGNDGYDYDGPESLRVKNVKTISNYAFQRCENLKTVSLENVEIVGQDAFFQCFDLEHADLTHVGSLYPFVFEATALKSVAMNGVEIINRNAFWGCDQLETITGLNTVGLIDGFAFYGCSSLKGLTVADLTKMGFNGDNYADVMDRVQAILDGKFSLDEAETIVELTPEAGWNSKVSRSENWNTYDHGTQLMEQARWTDAASNVAEVKTDVYYTAKQQMDYIFVVDLSASMAQLGNREDQNARFYDMQSKMLDMTEKLLTTPGYDCQVAIVTFGGTVLAPDGVTTQTQGTSQVIPFNTDKDAVMAAIKALVPLDQNTDYGLGLNKVLQLAQDHKNRNTTVIFMSDGQPVIDGTTQLTQGTLPAYRAKIAGMAAEIEALGIDIYGVLHSVSEKEHKGAVAAMEAVCSDGLFFEATNTKEFSESVNAAMSAANGGNYTVTIPVGANFSNVTDLRVSDGGGEAVLSADGRTITWTITGMPFTRHTLTYRMTPNAYGTLDVNSGNAVLSSDGTTVISVETPQLTRTQAPRSHTLTVRYQYANGTQAAATVTRTLTEGASYSITSPSISGYSPSRAAVSGVMGSTDLLITVTYTSTGGGGTTNPGGGGGGGGGGRPGTNPTNPGNTTTIGDTEVPLAGDLQLNKTDHFAYIKGYQDGTVRPNNPITRAQVATIFYRLLDDTSRVIYFQETNDFTDVANDYWANKAISTLTNAGIITGFSDGTFRPNAYITRAQFAAIAARFDNVVPGLNNPFTDVAEDYWARDLIAFAADRGWITGNGGKFRPLENITRVEVMDFINNVLERHVDEQGLLENATKWSDVPVTDPNYYVVEEATNSHDYTRRTEGQLMENWTQLNPDPVWDE